MALGHESPLSWGVRPAAAYVALLRVRRVLLMWREEPELPDRICIALQKTVTWAYYPSFRVTP